MLNVLRNLTISVAFYGKFATLSDFIKKCKFFFENPIFFNRKALILNVFGNFTNSVALYGKFATIWLTKLTFKHVNNRCWLVYASSIGKHRVKNAPIWEDDFAFHIFKMAQKTKTSQPSQNYDSNNNLDHVNNIIHFLGNPVRKACLYGLIV